MKRVLFSSLLILAVAVGGCESASQTEYREQARDPELLHAAVNQLTRVMLHDIFSPPQASRAYAYPSVAAYEALAPAHSKQRSLAGQLNGLASVPQPDTTRAHVFPLASVHAFLTVAEEMVYSVDRMTAFHEDMLARYRRMGIPDEVYARSVAYGDRVAQHVLAWAERDGYAQLRSAPGYTVTDEPGRWKPTPPAYMNGIGANWNMLRPFVLDSASQYRPARPHPYSMEEGSPFYKQVREVYKIGQDLTPEQREIAGFWDCNPYAVHKRGHASYATKQITPGGHWMRIGAIAARKTNADMMHTAETYAKVAVAVADGFISSFDEKYRSNLIRPETVINKHFDASWRPALQTPPFPEYTSAHSVISVSAATALTDLYGNSFAFRDTSEVAFGLPVRSFASFQEAAQEAAISRVYGGIHYRMAAQRGVDQGKQVGQFVVENVDTRASALLAQNE